MICYWASWAGDSEKSLKRIAQFYELYHEDVYFLAINITDGDKETRETADTFLADKSYPFPVFYDLDGVCHAAFRVNTKPTTFFLKENCWAMAYFKGNLTKYGMNMGMKCILPADKIKK